MGYVEFMEWRGQYLNNSGLLWFEVGNVDLDPSSWEGVIRYVNEVSGRVKVNSSSSSSSIEEGEEDR